MPRGFTRNLNRWAFLLLILNCLLAGPALAEADAHADTELSKKAPATTASHYERTPLGPSLETDHLDDILSELAKPTAAALSMWDQISAWFEQFFEDQSQMTIPQWLEDFRLSETTAQWIFYLACALIVLLSAGIIWNELRHASARRRWKQTAADTNDPALGLAAAPQLPLSEIPLIELPAYLLGLLIRRTDIQSARPGSLTHRELIQAMQTLAPAQREPLIGITTVAERIRYAPRPPESNEIEQAVASAKILIDKLDAPGR